MAAASSAGPSAQLGFTLIELMVTVSIVGVLAAIAVPAYKDFRKRGFEAVGVSYMRSWPAAQELYLQAHGTYADADEDLDSLVVPTGVGYSFSIDSNGSQTERWFGRGTPTSGGLPHLFVDQSGVVLRSMAGRINP